MAHVLWWTLPSDTSSADLRASPATLKWLRTRFGVSLLFLESVAEESMGMKRGNGRFAFPIDADSARRVDLTYNFVNNERHCSVWRSERGCDTIYIVFNCLLKALEHFSAIGSSAHLNSSIPQDSTGSPDGEPSLNRDILLRPFAVEAILADASSFRMRNKLTSYRCMLFKLERRGTNEQKVGSLDEAFESLHRLTAYWHLLHRELADQQDVLSFVLSVIEDGDLRERGQYVAVSSTGSSCELGYATDAAGAADATRLAGAASRPSDFTQEGTSGERAYLEYQASRNLLWTGWVESYAARTKARTELFYNLANQRDSRTNIGLADTSRHIADETRKIAQDTRRDSSSMITVAALTLLFLPGTFVSTVFSMIFFDNGVDDQGRPTLAIMPQWWYFIAATVPLTVLVFGYWAYWQAMPTKLSLLGRLKQKLKLSKGRAMQLPLSMHDTTKTAVQLPLSMQDAAIAAMESSLCLQNREKGD